MPSKWVKQRTEPNKKSYNSGDEKSKKKFKDIANQVNANKTACKQAFYHWKKLEASTCLLDLEDQELQILEMIDKPRDLLKVIQKKLQLT